MKLKALRWIQEEEFDVLQVVGTMSTQQRKTVCWLIKLYMRVHNYNIHKLVDFFIHLLFKAEIAVPDNLFCVTSEA